MNLPDETNILTELNHFGASQKEGSQDSMELRKPISITIWKNVNFDIIVVSTEKISTKKSYNYSEKLTDNWGRPFIYIDPQYTSPLPFCMEPSSSKKVGVLWTRDMSHKERKKRSALQRYSV